MGLGIDVGEARQGDGGCPYCLAAFEEGERTVACVGCGVALHRPCARELVRCPTPGCARRLPAGVTLEADEGEEEPPAEVPTLSGEALAAFRSSLAFESPSESPSEATFEWTAHDREVFRTCVTGGAAAGAAYAFFDYGLSAEQLSVVLCVVLAFVAALPGAGVGALVALLGTTARRSEEDAPGALLMNSVLPILGASCGAAAGYWLLGAVVNPVRAGVWGALLGAAVGVYLGIRFFGWRRFLRWLRRRRHTP